MKAEIEQIDKIILALKVLKSDILKTEKLSEKAFNTCIQNSSMRQIEKANNDLNWQCMYLDKQRVRVSKLIQESELLVSIESKEYNPSGFHKYK